MTLQERVLQLFRGEPERWWTAKAVADYFTAHPGVRLPPASVRATVLNMFQKERLTRRRNDHGVYEFRFVEPSTEAPAPMQAFRPPPAAPVRAGGRDAMAIPSHVAPPVRSAPGRAIPTPPTQPAETKAVGREPGAEEVQAKAAPAPAAWPDPPKPAPPKQPDPPKPAPPVDHSRDEILVPVRGAAVNTLLRVWAKQGLLGETPEEVAEHLLRQAVWERHAKT